jgi:hypothetical protein
MDLDGKKAGLFVCGFSQVDDRAMTFNRIPI